MSCLAKKIMCGSPLNMYSLGLKLDLLWWWFTSLPNLPVSIVASILDRNIETFYSDFYNFNELKNRKNLFWQYNPCQNQYECHIPVPLILEDEGVNKRAWYSLFIIFAKPFRKHISFLNQITRIFKDEFATSEFSGGPNTPTNGSSNMVFFNTTVQVVL